MGNAEASQSSCLIRNQLRQSTRVLCLPEGACLADTSSLSWDVDFAGIADVAVDVVIGWGAEQVVKAPFYREDGLRLVVCLGEDDIRLFHVPNDAILFLRDYKGEVTARICCKDSDVWALVEYTDASAIVKAVDAAVASEKSREMLTPIAEADVLDVDVKMDTGIAQNVSANDSSEGPIGNDNAVTNESQIASPPHECYCPISQDIFVDPVLAADGFTYERYCIEEWWKRRGLLSPMTAEKMTSTCLTPNLAIRALCQEYRGLQHTRGRAENSSGFYARHLPLLCEMFPTLETSEVDAICNALLAEGLEDLDVCVRRLLQHAGSNGSEVAAVSLTPICCATEAQAEESVALAAALLEPAVSVPISWPEGREEIFATLLELRFSPVRARKAIDLGDADTIEEAVVWLERHQDDPNIDTPMEVLFHQEALNLALDVLRVATVPAAYRLQCFQALHQILGNILKDPASEKLRKIRTSNQTFRERILRFSQAVTLLRRVGFTQGDFWTSATQREPCLEFRLPVDSDNIASQRFVRAYSLIDVILAAPDEWFPLVPESQPEVQSEWAQKHLEDVIKESSTSQGNTSLPPREYLAELHTRRVQDPRNYHRTMVAAGKVSNPVVVDIRESSREQAQAEARAQALSSAVPSQGSSGYRRLADRFGGRRHFDLKDIEAMRVEEAIGNTPQYAKDWVRDQGSSESYADLVSRSYHPQYLGLRAIDDTNIFRGRNQMPPLRWSQALADIAAEHARQMARGEMPFSHKGFDDRVRRYPFPYVSAAENLAYNSGVADAAGRAVEGWINSPGHRKNLLGAFDLCGIGVAQSSTGEFFFTQLFGRTLGGALC